MAGSSASHTHSKASGSATGRGSSYVRSEIRTAVNYSQSALATSAQLAWLYVCVLAVSFACSCWLLQHLNPVNTQHWEAFNQHVPEWVFTAQVAAFGGVLVLNIINLCFCSAPVQYNCNVLLALIHGVAFATDYLLDIHATPVVVSWGGRMFVPLRYIQWLHTTPTMILLMAMMSSTSSVGLTGAVGADLVMVATGLAATWTDGLTQIVCLTLSMVAFVGVMAAIIHMFRGALAETQHDPGLHGLMEKFLWVTLVVWTLFPLVWMAAWLGWVSLSTEQLFWGVSDYGAKVVFSSHLWQKNLATVQQRRETAQELLRALDRGVLLERLRGVLAAKERLVHALQHELTTPIHGMMALVQELLHNKTQSASSRTRMLLMIRSSAVCLLNTISTALNSSNNITTPEGGGGGGVMMAAAAAAGGDGSEGEAAGGGGGGGGKKHKVQLWRVAESVVRLTRPLMRDHVRILNCTSKDMPPVRGDSARIMQVLMNLVCSSLKYTHSGSIKISASQTHKCALVVVSDTGAGIPAQQLSQALDPFEVAEASQSGAVGVSAPELWDVCRTGLGLYLVKQTLLGMGSNLSVTSEVGRGSTYEFELPLADSDDDSESEVDGDLFSETASLRGSLDLLGPSTAAATAAAAIDSPLRRRSLDQQGGGHLGQLMRSNNSSSRDLGAGGVGGGGASSSSGGGVGGDAAAASTAAAGGDGSTGAGGGHLMLGTTLLSGVGGVGSVAGAVDAAAAAVAAGAGAAAGLVRKQNHRVVNNGVIQVLSVDDDQVNQLVASTALKLHKWEVVKCMSGADALDYLLQRCVVLPDLVLLDVMMPTMSGYEVAKRIREVWPSSLLPIIMVSAKTEEDDIVQGLHCGADDYVPKPFKRAELAARIRAHIRARDAFQQQQATEQQWLLQHNLLPLNVQRKLRNGETVIAESHPAATVLWAEVLGPPATPPAAVSPTAAAAAADSRSSSGGGAGSSSNPLQAALTHITGHKSLAGGGDGAPASAAADGDEDAAASAAAGGSAGSDSMLMGVGPFPPGFSPAEAVVRLNSLYTTWEELCAKQDVLGVDFSGSTFVAVSGHDDHPAHTRLILRAAAAMLGVAAASTQPDGTPLAVRVGIHTGPLTTGLVGSKAVKLVLMGDTVEGARQLAATGCPGAAHISSEVLAALQRTTAGSGVGGGDDAAAAAAAAAAASPWTHQRLPGAPSRLQTYLLHTTPTAKAAAAAAGGGAADDDVEPAVEVIEQQQQQGVVVVGSSNKAVSTTPSPQTALQRAVAAAAAAADKAATDNSSAAAAGGGDAGSSSQQSTATPVTQAPAAEAAAASSTTSSGRDQQLQWQQSSLLSPTPRKQLPAAANSPPPARVSVATSVSSLAVAPCSELQASSGSTAGVSSSQPPAAADATAAATAATAATAAMVACLTGAAAGSSSEGQQGAAAAAAATTGSSGSAASADAASLLALQQAGSTLIAQLGAERRQLQEQLLERTQQHAAAAAELSCVRQALAQTTAVAEHREQQVEALRQQVSGLYMRAQLSDCWQALATMKTQVGSLAAAGAGAGASASGGLSGPGVGSVGQGVGQIQAAASGPAGLLLGQQQQQQQVGALVPRAAGSSAGGTLAASAVTGSSGGGGDMLPVVQQIQQMQQQLQAQLQQQQQQQQQR